MKQKACPPSYLLYSGMEREREREREREKGGGGRTRGGDQELVTMRLRAVCKAGWRERGGGGGLGAGGVGGVRELVTMRFRVVLCLGASAVFPEVL